ncbi:MAG: hypothetical protein K2X03_14615 [Bryobacteraceae bacterium]|nr:hypothetical protein [Bryobacteraceae bacterium]
MAQLPGVGPVPIQGYGANSINVPTQNLICSVSSVPLTVRTEGFSELLGDVRLTCNGGLQVNSRNWRVGTDTAPAAPLPQLVNLSVTLSTPVTSRLVGGTNMTEALLFIGGASGEEATNAIGGTSVTNQNPCPVANVNANGVCSTLAALDGTNNTTPTPGNSRPTAVGINLGAATSEASNPINVFQGQLQNSNTVVFLGVPVSQVDSSQNPNIVNALTLYVLSISPTQTPNNLLYTGQPISVPFVKNFRIKNLRGAIPGAAAPNGQVSAFLSIQNPPANLQLSSASAVVGFVQLGLTFDRRTAINDGASGGLAYAQCDDINRNLAVDATSTSLGSSNQSGLLLRYTEGYANSFKIRGFLPGQSQAFDQNDPTVIYNSESGFYNTRWAGLSNGIDRAGIADTGTRLRAGFGTVPANIRLYVTVGNVNGSSTASIGAYGVVTDATGANQSPITVPVFSTTTTPYTATTTGVTFGNVLTPFGPTAFSGPAGSPFQSLSSTQGYVQVAVTNGAASFTWEVYSADPRNPEAALFQVIAAWRFSQNPGLGTSTVQGSFAPINSTATASGFLVPIPRFQDTSTPATLFRLDSCVTNLLFPFVTNIAPFDTGLAISNTSLSNPGTGELFPLVAVATQQGACSVNYFGFTGSGRGAAPAPATSGVIPAGQTLVWTLSAGGGAPFGNIPATPGFQGYIIAQCAFRYAHGYAFISDIGATQLAQGYLALVMDAALGSRTGNSSESLGN